MGNIFISGITSGIGKALALYFANTGYRVFGIGRRPLGFVHANISYRQLDLGELDKIDENLQALLGNNAKLDVAILNAAVLGKIDRLQVTTLGELKTQMDINLWAQKIIIETLLQTNPRIKNIVGISSGAALKGELGWNGYSISKAAFNMLIQLYASEYPHTHFIALAPGLVETPMQDLLAIQARNNGLSSIVPIETLKALRSIRSAEEFAQLFAGLLPVISRYESGSYVDIREIQDVNNF
jgi:NAD(P)-dependent dehydrogenase (short-subunit alcohol dehydrogenase family)